MNDIKLRVARISDAAELLALYAPYVEETAISFETAVPSLDEFTSRMVHKLPRYPYIVAEKDGELLGYSYLSPLSAARPTTGRRRRRYICALTAATSASEKCCTRRLSASPAPRA